MKLSWSHKLFFFINRHIGQRPWLDRFMIFCATWLVHVMVCIFILWVFLTAGWDVEVMFDSMLTTTLLFLLFAALVSFGIGYAVALLWKHQRPVREFPTIKELIEPIGTWKSFPSDHAIGVTLLCIGAWVTAMPMIFFISFLACAVLVAFSRVYVGVHYPRDIIGGVAVAVLSSVFVFEAISKLFVRMF